MPIESLILGITEAESPCVTSYLHQVYSPIISAAHGLCMGRSWNQRAEMRWLLAVSRKGELGASLNHILIIVGGLRGKLEGTER